MQTNRIMCRYILLSNSYKILALEQKVTLKHRKMIHEFRNKELLQ